MKKILLLILCLALAASVVFAMTACGDKNRGNDTENGGEDANDDACKDRHYDTDEDGFCDLCEAAMPENKANVTFTVKDQDGTLISGVKVTFTSKTDAKNVVTTAASGSDGKITAELKYGNYGVDYDYDVEAIGYFLIDTYSVIVAEGTTAIDLKLINNTPNGTAERPYSLAAGENTLEIDAGKTEHFVIYHTVNLYIVIDGEGIEVTYNGEKKSPDGEGVITFELIGEDTNSSAIVAIENKNTAKVSVSATVNSKPGTQSNPVAITALGESVSTESYTFETVYFNYVATADGIFSIKITSEKSSVRLQNGNQTADSTNDADADGVISIEVKAGDTVVIDCTAVDENLTDNVVPFVTFVPNFTPTAE